MIHPGIESALLIWLISISNAKLDMKKWVWDQKITLRDERHRLFFRGKIETFKAGEKNRGHEPQKEQSSKAQRMGIKFVPGLQGR